MKIYPFLLRSISSFRSQKVSGSEFLDHDRQQWRFGLLRIAQDIADMKIENEGTMEEFHAQIDALLEGNYESTLEFLK